MDEGKESRARSKESVEYCINTIEPYNENSFVVILDGFIISDNIECTYVQNIDTGYQCTDHNPVLMKFMLED
ncbi:MAG: hypothetical protein E7496_05345 [Ruminococcus sp.]|nr:hypothetical protein [Ruminococcus sp.]